MKRMDRNRKARGVFLLEVLTLGALLPMAGCYGGRDEAFDPEDAPTLAALIEDGPLPATMAAGAAREAPPRSCNSESDGGMPEPDASGGSTGGADGGMGGTTGGGGSTGGSSGGTMGGSTGATGGPENPDGSCEGVPIGFWRFDDCNDARSDLADSSPEGHSAFRNVDLECVDGQEGQAASFAATEDLVYAPDQPGFVLDQGVTVATWVKPSRVDGVSTLFRKRDDANSAFALLIHGKKFQFVVKLASGRLATVSAPAKAGVWTHVAATYDGTFLRLYKDGSEVSRSRAPGALARGAGPLLMGNDIQQRRLRGLMDNAWFNTLAAPAEKIMELTCLHAAPTLTLTPEVGPAVAPGTPVTYQLALTNRNSATCPPAVFSTFVNPPIEFSVEPQFTETEPLASGASTSTAFEVMSGEDAEPGSYPLDFQVAMFSDQFFLEAQARAQYVVVEPTGCHVSSGRELMIRDLSVVEDPLRSALTGPAADPRTGAWTFARMMERLSRTPADAPDVTEAMLRTFLSPQVINGFTVSPRSAMDPVVLRPWPRTANGKLDLARAPLRLLAIVNRLDLKDLSKGKAGEGRMVYGVLDAEGNPLEFTVIFEYALPARTEGEARAWADRVHALQALPFPSEAYNAALQELTDRFSGRGGLPGAPNDNALIDIRTNEIALSGQWELREFRISGATGILEPAPLAQTPDFSFNGTEALGRFVNTNEAIILTETHETPASFEGRNFQAAAVFNNIDFWSAPDITNPEARHKFSLNTCNGCHGAETQTGFLHINPRIPGQVSTLSGFLTGVTVSDPISGEPRRLAELRRRRLALESVVCAEQ